MKYIKFLWRGSNVQSVRNSYYDLKLTSSELLQERDGPLPMPVERCPFSSSFPSLELLESEFEELELCCSSFCVTVTVKDGWLIITYVNLTLLTLTVSALLQAPIASTHKFTKTRCYRAVAKSLTEQKVIKPNLTLNFVKRFTNLGYVLSFRVRLSVIST